jgi:hypothetical protein
MRRWRRLTKRLRYISGYKVAIPQDEYAETDVLCGLLREFNVKTVFTCFTKQEFAEVYPSEKVPLENCVSVFPGYVDEIAVRRIESSCTNCRERPIDLGYRARRLPYWLGRQGQLKNEIGQIFLQKTRGTRLKIDISTDFADVFLGEEWYKFLCRTRAVLGCEGGASLMDPTGKIRTIVEEYVKEKPEATLDEVESNCFPGLDCNIHLFTLSPRHFECAITRTCQVLLEGHYGGIFLPGVHYIEVKRDYSNVDRVVELLHDKEYCAEIAENTYRDIVLSGKYTYRVFANMVIDHIAEKRGRQYEETRGGEKYFFLLGKYLTLREYFEGVFGKAFFVWLLLKLYRTGIVKKMWQNMTRKRK